MQFDEVVKFLEKKMPGVSVEASGEGCALKLIFTNKELVAMRPIIRQKLVYEHLTPYIENGQLHAITMQFKA